MKLLLKMVNTIAFILVIAQAEGYAEKVYTTHTGGSINLLDGTSPQNPVTLPAAIDIANSDPARNHLVLLSGTYNALPEMAINADNVMIEGGYEDLGSTWRKSYAPTELNFISSDVQVNSETVGLRGIYSAGTVGLELQDLQINLEGPSGIAPGGTGKSAYGVRLESCSDYTLRRVSINTGNATSGRNGRNGLSGSNGSSGSTGGAGNNDSGYANGGNGGYGGTGGVGAYQWTDGTSVPTASKGQAGQFGGCGGEGSRDQSGYYSWNGSYGGTSRTNDRNGLAGHRGEDGGKGAAGSNGASGSTGSAGQAVVVGSYVSGYYQPGIGGNGNGGTQGKGGRGGGGGGWHDDGLFSNDEAGGGGGGAGGGGGGGAGGEGAFGGGSAFAVSLYLCGSGIIEDCELIPGTAGQPGVPGQGGNGGNGGSYGAGGSKADNGYAGGNGGFGGYAGKGGAGGSAPAGVRYAVGQVNGTSPTLLGSMAGCTVNSNSTFGALPNLAPVPVNVAATDGTYSNKVVVTWDDVEEASGYEIYRNTSNNTATAGLFIGISASPPYEDTSATGDVNYHYWIKSVTPDGAGDFSQADSGYRAVTQLEFDNMGAEYDVSWNAVQGVTYTLERSTNLMESGWVEIHTVMPASNATYYVTDTNNAPERAFYRLSL